MVQYQKSLPHKIVKEYAKQNQHFESESRMQLKSAERRSIPALDG